tara:strand:- start:142 stop:567 length:426 start_codon:yes stop_codon:yes gene_type:complete
MLASFPAWDGRWDEQLPGNRSILGKNIDWVRKQVGEALYDASPHDTNLLTSGRDLGLRTSAMMPDALLYAAQTLLISCLVPRSQYLSFDISRGDRSAAPAPWTGWRPSCNARSTGRRCRPCQAVGKRPVRRAQFYKVWHVS